MRHEHRRPAISTHLSVFDNLLARIQLTGVGRARMGETLEIVHLLGTSLKHARHFSMGMKAWLTSGVAFLDFLSTIADGDVSS